MLLRAAALLLYFLAVSLPVLLSLSSGFDTNAAAAEAFSFLSLQSAFAIFALQPVLAARLPILDRLFGLDVVYLFHKMMGMTATAILLTAFVLFVYENKIPSAMDRAAIQAVSSLFAVALVVTALLYTQLRLTFERWRMLHNILAVPVIILLFLHLFLATEGYGVVAAIWVLLLLAGLSCYINHKFIGPMRRRRNPYRVVKIRQETYNTWVLRLKPNGVQKRFSFRPGQFQFLTFLSPGLANEEHPFTISSSPVEEDWHESTIKESGDFTSRISRIKNGDQIAVQAPFGRFSYSYYPDETDLVFIAGGIGLTPFMSMLRHMRDIRANLRVLLLYANRAEKDIVFREELAEISSGSFPRLKVVHILSRADESWPGERGHLDAAAIKRHLDGDAKDRVFYVCGPPLMMSAIIADLIRLGVPSSRVRSERFAL